jgi:predicted transcriptional regulator
MALPANCSVALLPIKPIYANAIMAGTKRVEFRKIGFRRPVTHVAVYASTPVQRIIGVFRVAAVEHAAPAALWRRHAKHGGITSEAFELYYEGSVTGLAIGVAEVVGLTEPIALDALGGSVTPPQSFRYLSTSEVARLRSALTVATVGAPPGDTPTLSNRRKADQTPRKRRISADSRHRGRRK